MKIHLEPPQMLYIKFQDYVVAILQSDSWKRDRCLDVAIGRSDC